MHLAFHTLTRTLATFIIVAVAVAADAQVPEKTRIGMIPIDVAGQAYYAQDEGFFKTRGLEVDLQTFSSGGAIYPAVISGALDIGAGNFVAIAQAHQRGIPFVLIAPAGSYSSATPSAGIAVAKSSAIKTPKDLMGKTIAVDSLKNLSYIAVASWAEKNGVDATKVRFVEMPMGAMGAAIAAGRIDAGSLVEPALSRVLTENDGRLLGRHFEAIAPQFLEGAWFCTADFAKAHPEAIRRFAAAMADSARWANANPAAAGSVLEKYSKAPPTPIQFRTFFPERLRAAEIQVLIDAAARYGAIDASFPATDLIAPGLGA